MTDTIDAPSQQPTQPPPGGSRLPLVPTPWEVAQRFWRALRKMSTALMLLFALAIATLIATFIPQEPVIAPTVRLWREGVEGPGVAVSRLLDALSLYDVFGSTWFAVITTLLFVSLTACLVPRWRIFLRNVRRAPARGTRLTRLTHRTEIPVDGAGVRAGELLGRAERVLRTFRTLRTQSPAGTPQLAVERGHWREFGSLVFHTSFYLLLIGISLGAAFSFTGQIDFVEGESFADTPIGYDSNTPGRFWDTGDHRGQLTTLEDFEVTYLPDGFTADEFVSTVTFASGDGERSETQEIRVNHPVHFDGLTYYQRGFGFAPRLTLTSGFDGSTVYSEQLILRTDPSGLWVGRGKVSVGSTDPDDDLPQIGIEVAFLPDATFDEDGRLLQRSPEPNNPRLLVALYLADDLGLDDPLPLSRLDWPQDALVDQQMLTPGDEVALAGLLVASFDDLAMWSGLQVSHQPFRWLLLTAASLTLMGLLPSLYAYRRRLWVEIHDDHVLVAGVAQQRQEQFEIEFEALTDRLRAALITEKPAPNQPTEDVT